mmetsp:Transcript_18291/g.28109  ORF Transcript_18291/g.28109 Transcript_18291/m.28109 type:complete len:177 (+) Transcript_18291:733-1263(+)
MMRQDLVDTDVCFCSEDVLAHFSDNFDKQDLNDEFINWLCESEILSDRVRFFEVEDLSTYYARVANPRLLGVVSRDIVQRHVYPLVVDMRTIDSKANYQYMMPDKYIEKTSSVQISSQIDSNSVVGYQTSIGKQCIIAGSVVGQNCAIGDGVKLTNCIIDRLVKIEDNCVLTNAIV